MKQSEIANSTLNEASIEDTTLYKALRFKRKEKDFLSSLIRISPSNSIVGRNKTPTNARQPSPQLFQHRTFPMFNNRSQVSKKTTSEDQSHLLESNQKTPSQQLKRSPSLPKVISRNSSTNQLLYRSTSRLIQNFNQKSHSVNKKEAEQLKKLYNEDQDYLDRLNKIKRNNNFALRPDFSCEKYQTLLLNESVKNISRKGLKKLQFNFKKINFLFNKKPHEHGYKMME